MTIDDVIARMGWAGQVDLAVESLSGGITNLNYRVVVDGRAFVIRIPGEDCEYLGIDRHREHACSLAAYRAGIAPAIEVYFEDAGVMVTHFVPGRELTVEEMHSPEMLSRVAGTLRRYHEGPEFRGMFSAFQTVRDYLAACAPRGAPLPDRFDWMLAQADRLESALGAPPVLRPCHNDLLLANWLDDGDRLWIIDWEYAAMGDIFFDFGNFAVHQGLTDAEERALLRAYFGRVTSAAVGRLKLMKIISDLREAMWAMVQVTISSLDYDFVGYGRKHFDRYVAQLEDRRLPVWLADAKQRE
ncbi:MAG: phosphotransferase [Armatimonadota bacterium]